MDATCISHGHRWIAADPSLTLLQSFVKPRAIDRHVAGVAGDESTVKGMLEADLAPALLTQERADDGTGLLAKGMTSDEIGHGQEDERMEGRPKSIGRLMIRE